jgi:hypothetical protein
MIRYRRFCYGRSNGWFGSGAGGSLLQQLRAAVREQLREQLPKRGHLS